MAEDLAFQLSQRGINVRKGADPQMIFSSKWPLLKIEKEGSFTIPSDDDITIYTHNLGYPAAFFVMHLSGGTSMTNPLVNSNIGINKNELKYFIGGNVSFPAKIYYYIFRLDLTKEFIAPITDLSAETAGGSSDNLVLRLSKESKDVNSHDLRDFVIHSDTQSPMIHQVATKIAITKNLAGQDIWAVKANHNLGYYPLFFPFVSSSGYYRFTGNYTQSTPRVFGTTEYTQIDLDLASQPTPAPASLIVFKDPHQVLIPQETIGV